MANNSSTSFWKKADRFIKEAFGEEDSGLYLIVNNVIVFLIFYSIITIILSSVENIYQSHQKFFDISEIVVVILFTIEYICNIYAAKNRKKYIFGPWGFIDLVSIIPSYLTGIDLRDMKTLRVLRILRFLRLLKLTKQIGSKYDASKHKKMNTFKIDLEIYFIALFSVVVVFSTLMYYAERGYADTLFTSIPATMWWCIVTITTVGYGDMFPKTIIGKLIASGTMLSGLALFGLLMNVIGKVMMASLFGEETTGEEKKEGIGL